MKIGIKKVAARKIEGVAAGDRIEGTLEGVEERLKQWAQFAPTAGYDKVAFEIEFEDGALHEGRIDLKRKYAEDGYSIRGHVRDYLEFLVGKNRPAHMSEVSYRQYVERRPSEMIERARAFLDRYDV